MTPVPQVVAPVPARRLNGLSNAQVSGVPSPTSVRIKDITSIEGHRANRVTGIGLVTGLKGTGGKSLLTQNLARNMLRNFDILADQVATNNLSVVAVTAEIPAYVRPGETINATVSIFDDGIGLYGGELQSTALKGLDGQVYAVAGGGLVLGGFSAGGQGAAVTKNHDTTGKVQATIEVGIQNGPAFPGNSFSLLLKNNDYSTAQRIATEINRHFPRHAYADDQGRVKVQFPHPSRVSKLDFVVKVNSLRVTPDIPARVVINQKSGTIVVGKDVRLSQVLLAHDNLIIATSETPVASQPAPFSQGETVVLPRTELNVTSTGGGYNILNRQTTVGDLASALNALGVSPQDLIAVFQSIQDSGALQATLIIQ
ncbi:MAG: flagellar basal body P-ring protein FlgI [Mariniblastus sp.]